MNEDKLLELLNAAWALVEPKWHYDNFNTRFPVADIPALEKLEEESNILGVTGFAPFEKQIDPAYYEGTIAIEGMTILSWIATITDGLCGRRLAAIVQQDGTITGWQWATLNQQGPV